MYNIENIKTFLIRKINANSIAVPIIIEKNIRLALEKAKNEMKSSVSVRFYNDLIAPIYFLHVSETTLFFVVKNTFVKNQLSAEIKDDFLTKINDILDSNFLLDFVVESDKEKMLKLFKNSGPEETPKSVVGFTQKTGLNKYYTFNNFVVGEFNKDVFGISKTLLTNKNWKTLCVVGGVGQGKTHFLHAFGTAYYEKHKDSNVRLVTSQEFVREFYNAFGSSSSVVEKLKNKYRGYDLLMIDDFDFMSKKTKINEILLSLLVENKNQNFVFSLNNFPNTFPGIDERIVSRLRSGLIYKINEPTKEDFKKILINLIKKHDKNLMFSDDSLTYVVNRCQNDLRVLEGIVQRLLFSFSTETQNKKIITIEIIKKMVNTEIFDINPKLSNVSADVVLKEVCLSYNVPVESVISKSQEKILTHIRHVCFYVLKEKLDLPWTTIGKLVGNRSHSTVIEGYKKINKTINKDLALKNYINKIYEKI